MVDITHIKDTTDIKDIKCKIVPITPSREHLISIAIRYSHDFGLLSKDQQENIIRFAAQMYEECIGEGFYKFPDEITQEQYQKQLSFYNGFTNNGEQ